MINEVISIAILAVGALIVSVIGLFALILVKNTNVAVAMLVLSFIFSFASFITADAVKDGLAIIERQPASGEHKMGCSFTEGQKLYIGAFDKEYNKPKFYVFPKADVETASTSKEPYFVTKKRLAGSEGKQITTAILYQ